MELTIGASEFKAKCLDVLRRLRERRLTRVTITHKGAPVAVLTPPAVTEAEARSAFGCMAGTVHIPDDIDLTEPVFEGETDAEKGILYNG